MTYSISHFMELAAKLKGGVGKHKQAENPKYRILAVP